MGEILEKALREILAKIRDNPQYYPSPPDVDVDQVVKEVKKRILNIFLQHKDSERFAYMLDDILSPEYHRRLTTAYYYLINELGFTKDRSIELIINSLEVSIGLKQDKDLFPIERTIVDYVIEIIRRRKHVFIIPIKHA